MPMYSSFVSKFDLMPAVKRQGEARIHQSKASIWHGFEFYDLIIAHVRLGLSSFFEGIMIRFMVNVKL